LIIKTYYMKKSFFTLCLFVAFTTNTKAQTKEETITWLQEKLQKYIYYDMFGSKGEDIRVKVSECFITITFTRATTEYQKPVKYYNQYFIIPTDGAQFGFYIEMKDRVKSIRSKQYDHTEGFTGTADVHITEGEEKLKERLNKAVTHLATFCPKKVETF